MLKSATRAAAASLVLVLTVRKASQGDERDEHMCEKEVEVETVLIQFLLSMLVNIRNKICKLTGKSSTAPSARFTGSCKTSRDIPVNCCNTTM